MRSLILIFRRHPGKIVAFALTAALLGATAWLAWPGPRASWTWADPTPTDNVELEYAPDGRTALLTLWRSAGGADFEVRDLTDGHVTRINVPESKRSSTDRAVTVRFQLMGEGRYVLGRLAESDESFQSLPNGILRNDWLKIWDVRTGDVVWRFPREISKKPGSGQLSSPLEIEVAENASALTYRTTDQGATGFSLWVANEKAPPREIPDGVPLAFSADGRCLAVGLSKGEGAKIEVRDILLRRPLGSIPVVKIPEPRAVALSLDGLQLAEKQGQITVVHDLLDSSKHVRLAMNGWPRPRFSTDGSLLHLGGSDMEDEVWDLKSNPPAKVFEGDVLGIAADGRRLLHGGESKLDDINTIDKRQPTLPLQVLDLPSKRVVGPPLTGSTDGYQLSPDGRLVLAARQRVDRRIMATLTDWIPRSVRPIVPRYRSTLESIIVDVFTGKAIKTIEHLDQFRPEFQIEFSADGSTLAFFHLDNQQEAGIVMTLELWDTRDRPSPWPFIIPVCLMIMFSGFCVDAWIKRSAPLWTVNGASS